MPCRNDMIQTFVSWRNLRKVSKVSGEFMEALKAAAIFSCPLSSSGFRILNSFTGERDSKVLELLPRDSKVFELLFELAQVIQKIAISKKLQEKWRVIAI